MKKHIKNILFYFVLVAVPLVSCDVLPCAENDGVALNVGFYKIENQIVQDTTIDSVMIYPLDASEIYINNLNTSTSSVALPLMVDNDTTVYIFVLDSTVYDTLTLIAARELVLETHECGFEQFFYLQEVKYTSNKIDSVWIRKELVEYGEVENIKISF